MEQEAEGILEEAASKEAIKNLEEEKESPFDFLASEDVPVFSDDITLFMNNELFKCSLVIVDIMVFLLYREKKTLVTQPIKLEDLSTLILSPSLPTTAALKLKDTKNHGSSHVILQSLSMSLLIKFFQELELYDLKVEFHEEFPMI